MNHTDRHGVGNSDPLDARCIAAAVRPLQDTRCIAAAVLPSTDRAAAHPVSR